MTGRFFGCGLEVWGSFLNNTRRINGEGILKYLHAGYKEGDDMVLKSFIGTLVNNTNK